MDSVVLPASRQAPSITYFGILSISLSVRTYHSSRNPLVPLACTNPLVPHPACTLHLYPPLTALSVRTHEQPPYRMALKIDNLSTNNFTRELLTDEFYPCIIMALPY